MSIIKIASFGYEIFVVLSRTQSIYNVRSFRQIRVNNVLFVVQYLTKKRSHGQCAEGTDRQMDGRTPDIMLSARHGQCNNNRTGVPRQALTLFPENGKRK